MENSFRTVLPAVPSTWKIEPRDEIITLGSCFSDEIGQKLQSAKFNCLVNPLGTLFNPVSIHKLIAYSLKGQVPEESYVKRDDLWFHHDFHSSFCAFNKNTLKEEIMAGLKKLKQSLERARFLIITWGTSVVYKKKDTIVANCHKFPADSFEKELLSAKDIANDFTNLTRTLSAFDHLKIIVTVSPVRHIKDTVPLNNVSKSILRYAAHLVTEEAHNAFYYPSFEIMMDDLRDYRFYKEDLIHPNSQAIDYIWDHFSRTFFSDNTREQNKKWNKIQKGLLHKPFNEKSKKHIDFLTNLLKQMQEFSRQANIIQEMHELEKKIQRLKNEV